MKVWVQQINGKPPRAQSTCYLTQDEGEAELAGLIKMGIVSLVETEVVSVAYEAVVVYEDFASDHMSLHSSHSAAAIEAERLLRSVEGVKDTYVVVRPIY